MSARDCRCDGSGIVLDDGTVTDMIGWPLPCPCAESVPAELRRYARRAVPAGSAL